MPLDYGDRPLNQQHVVNNYNEEHHFVNYGSDRASFRKDTATNTNSYTLVENNRNSRTWYYITPMLSEMYLLLLVNHIYERAFSTGTTPCQLGGLLLPLLPSTLDT